MGTGFREELRHSVRPKSTTRRQACGSPPAAFVSRARRALARPANLFSATHLSIQIATHLSIQIAGA